MPEPLNADERPIYDASRVAGTGEKLAYMAVQKVHEVTAANLIAQVMAKLDTQNSKLNMLMWMVGAAVAVIGILVRLWG